MIVRLKKTICIILCAIVLISGLNITAYSATDLNLTGTSALIYCADTDEVIYEKNADEKMDLASITKLLTCLVAIEKLDMNQQIEITGEAASMPKSNIDLKEGELMSVENLIAASLISSANDAATALGLACGGSMENFASMMNDRAAQIGCTSSNFVNSSGYTVEGHYSTARDVAKIAKAAFSNKDIRRLAGLSKYTIPATNLSSAREIESTNLFLEGFEGDGEELDFKVEKYKGVFGGKTGITVGGECTMVTGFNHDGMEIYCVIMGSTLEGRYSDIKTLMDYAKTVICKYTVFKKDTEFGTAKLLGGATNKVKAVAAKEGFINLPEGASASLVETKCIYSDSLIAPIKKGQKIGVVEIYLADDLCGKVDLVAASDIKKGWFLSPFGITNMQTIMMGSALGLFIITVITVFVLRIKNKRRIKAIRRERLMEEARRQLEREEDLKRRGWHF